MKQLRYVAVVLMLFIAVGALVSCTRALPAEIEVLGYIAPADNASNETDIGVEDFHSNYRIEDAHPIPMQFFYQHSLESIINDADAIVIGRLTSSSNTQKLSFKAHGAGIDELFLIDGRVNRVQAMSVLKGQLTPGAMLEIRTCDAFLGSTLDATTLEDIVYAASDLLALREDATYLFFLKQTDDSSLYLVNELQGALEIQGDVIRSHGNIVPDQTPVASILNDVWTHMANPQVLSHNRPFFIEE